MTRSDSEIQNLKSKMDMGGRINACRMRLRHARAMQRAAASDAAAEPQTPACAPLRQSGDGERLSLDAATISIEADSHVDWIEDGAMP